jgi:hypothetical protein
MAQGLSSELAKILNALLGHPATELEAFNSEYVRRLVETRPQLLGHLRNCLDKESTNHTLSDVLVPLNKIVNNNLAQTLETLSVVVASEEDDGLIKIGANCCNKGCDSSYKGPESITEDCRHHTGAPVFHEGMKFWSCCQRKTSDFNAFLKQEGCSTGRHLWVKPKVEEGDLDKTKTCRVDWHQTASHVVLAVYAKVPLPDLSVVEASSNRLVVSIIFGQDQKEYSNHFRLGGLVDVEKSSVNFLGSKVEISLKKAEPVYWSKYELPAEDN